MDFDIHFFFLRIHACALRLIKREALACKGEALDCFPLGSHAYPPSKMHAYLPIPFALCLRPPYKKEGEGCSFWSLYAPFGCA